ncbi:gliding motility lipoprotein GldB [Solitalea lacus]|uniref:gliding motility lipoprotein GldB n=1 Tax=Solitalea lacus TaxID=2911172 RepID=UPI001EDAB44C|nr:gliding motility lipoprotein GldB [Solitalea lacus]UKJ07317.1 gliding motility lipoprotein GldB [Solitalea lacus]
MPKIKVTFTYLITCLPLLGLFGCYNNKKHPDVSNINLTIKINRFENDLFNLDTTNIAQSAAQLRKKYPDFYSVYFRNILRSNDPNDPNNLQLIQMIRNNHDFKLLKHDVDSVYPQLQNVEEQFTDAFKYYKYYFPKGNVPQLVSYIADFQLGASTVNNTLAVELDMFMGKGYRFYQSKNVNLPNFIQRKLNKDHIVPTAMKAFAQQLYPLDETDKTLLHQMIYQGKILYFLDNILPDMPDSAKIGFSQKQIDWCNTYKADVWTDLMAQNILYSTDELKYAKYLNDAPFTSGLENDSAPMLGVWTGWQIVRQYMNEHPEITLAQLMSESDSQKILKDSKYKPK